GGGGGVWGREGGGEAAGGRAAAVAPPPPFDPRPADREREIARRRQHEPARSRAFATVFFVSRRGHIPPAGNIDRDVIGRGVCERVRPRGILVNDPPAFAMHRNLRIPVRREHEIVGGCVRRRRR